MGAQKACYTTGGASVGKASAAPGRKCADEGGKCSFDGLRTVYYGAGTSFYTRQVLSQIACNNEAFGDPLVGTQKACYVDDSVSPVRQRGN